MAPASTFMVRACVVAMLGLAACASPAKSWRGRSIYFVVTDRFANGDPSNDDADGYRSNRADASAWHGGDFAGIRQHLAYIAGMGFTALWITPVVQQHDAHAYHGYWAWDFGKIDGHLGDLRELRALVDDAHARGIAVMIDTVANHTGRYDYRAASFPDPALYHHNGDITNWDDPNQLLNFDMKGLNDLDQDQPRVRRALLDHLRWLVAVTGADGLRIDTAKHVPMSFWREASAAAGIFTLGEVLDGDVRKVAPYSHALAAALDYPLYYQIKNVLALGQSARMLSALFANDHQYRDVLLNGVFADNHDQPRFSCTLSEETSAADRERDLRLALALTFTVRGLPILYYGTEQGLAGCSNNREDMVRFDVEAPLYKYVAQLNRLRNAALKGGTQRERWVDDTTYAFERHAGKSAALVGLNLGATARTIDLEHLAAAPGTVFRDAMAGTATATVKADRSISLTIAARSVLILTAN